MRGTRKRAKSLDCVDIDPQDLALPNPDEVELQPSSGPKSSREHNEDKGTTQKGKLGLRNQASENFSRSQVFLPTTQEDEEESSGEPNPTMESNNNILSDRESEMGQELAKPNIILEEMEGGKWYGCKGGAFQSVAVWMATYNQDKRDLHAFLLCYRQFASPEDLFGIIMALYGYNHPELVQPKEPIAEVISPSKKARLSIFLVEWLEHYFTQDFQKRAIFQHLINFTKVTKNLQQDEMKRLKLLFIQKPRPSGESPWLTSKATRPISLVDTKASTLAEQLTFIDAKQFRSIKQEEFLDTAWTKKNKEDLAPNLLNFCHRFNQVSWWVATQIVEATDSKKQRSLLVKFISAAESCHMLGNYNSLMAILSGLNNFSIQRLKRAWLIPAKHKDLFDKLEILMEPKQNFKNYRQDIDKKAREVNNCVIPYLAMYLRDITFVYDGNNDYLDDGKQLINCEKLGLIYDQINEIKRYQKGIANLNVEQDASVCSYLLDVTYLDEETLHEKSLQCEPPRGMVHPEEKVEGVKEASIFGPDKTITKPPFSWTVANVQEWLESKDMGQYKDLFAKKTINGAQILELNNRTLLALGISNLVHRKQMLKAIQALQAMDFNNYSSASQTWKTKNTRDWTPMDVCMWLESIELKEYKKAFLENQVAGAELLDLENDDLLAMNITRLGHRKRLLMKKQELLPSKTYKRRNSAPANDYPVGDLSSGGEEGGNSSSTESKKIEKRRSWSSHFRRASDGSDDTVEDGEHQEQEEEYRMTRSVDSSTGASDKEDSDSSKDTDRKKSLKRSKSRSRSKSSGGSHEGKESGSVERKHGKGEKGEGKRERLSSSSSHGKSKSLTSPGDTLLEEPEGLLSPSTRDKIDPRAADGLNDTEDMNENSSATLAIKCYFNKDIRVLRVEKDINLVQLKERITQEYRLDVETVTVKYKDLEEDRITIRNEDDLKFAMLSIGSSSFLKLFVSL